MPTTAFGLGFGYRHGGPSRGGGGGVGDAFVPIGARGRGIPGTAGTSTGAFDSFNGQNVYWNLSDTAIAEMKVVWADWEMSAAGPSAKPAGAVFNNFAAGVNYQNVSQGGFTFSGAASTTIGAPSSAAAFSYVMSDVKTVSIAANNSFGIREYGSMSVGTDFALADFQGSALANGTRLISAPSTPGGAAKTGFTEGLTRANGTANTTTGTSNPSHTGVGWFPPAIVLGKVNNPTKSVVLFGDSIAQGQSGDWPDDLGNLGYALRTLRNAIPFLNLSRGTLQASFLNTTAQRAGIDALSIGTGMYATDFVCALGRNDMAGSSSAATIKADVDFVCAPQKAAGRQCWVATIPPWTTSSDAWITTANQTAANAGKETIRAAYNADRLANYVAQGYKGVIDVAAPVESSGKWACPFAQITLSTPITTAGQVGDITVSSTATYTAQGFSFVLLLFGTELIYCAIKNGTTLTIVGRGAAGTTAATYIATQTIDAPLTNDGIHPNFNGHELIRLAGTFGASKFGAGLVLPSTWNSADSGSVITLSGGNLTADGNTATSIGKVRATNGRSSGKYYFEIAYPDEQGASFCGLAGAATPLNTNVGTDANSYGIRYSGNKYNSNVDGGAILGSFTFAGLVHVLMVAVDLTAGLIWFGRDGTFSGSPSAGTGAAYSGLSGLYFPAASPGTSANRKVLRCALASFQTAPPSGFSAWL